MEARQFTTSSQPDGRKLAWWQDILSDVYYKLEVFSDHRDDLRAVIAEQVFGPASVTLFAADNQRVLRTRSRIAQDDDDSFSLVMPRQAPVYFSQLGRNGFVYPGSYVLVQTTEYYELSCPDGFSNVTVKLPGSLVRQHLPFADDHCAARFTPDPVMGKLLHDFALWLTDHAETLPEPLARQMGQQLMELLAALLTAEAKPQLDVETPGALALRRRIDRHLRERLLDPALTPAAVAEAFGISTSYLHRLFRPTGMTIGRWIHQARLQRGYEMLTHQGGNHLSVAEIAYAVSFSSQAHFARSFRQQFRVTPGEARKLARQSTYLDRLRGRMTA